MQSSESLLVESFRTLLKQRTDLLAGYLAKKWLANLAKIFKAAENYRLINSTRIRQLA